MKNRGLILAALAAFLLVGRGSVEAQSRNDPIDVNLVIDGSRYTRDQAEEISEWICGYVIDGMLQEGDYLRIRIAEGEVQTLYAGLFKGEEGESIKALLRKPLPGSETADFARALEGLASPVGRRSLITYTLLISSARGLSPVHLGAASSHLRFSRVMDFPGWRALVIAPDIGPRVREAADAFLAGG
jgi:hypothetical protein